MEANELRIGNYIRKGVVCCKVNSIHVVEDHPKKEWHVRVSGFSNDNSHCFFGNDVEPIPLTEEWLVKFGFEKHSIGTCFIKKYQEQGELLIFSYDTPAGNSMGLLKGDYYYMFHRTAHVIKHVHQLQNLYFSLTGEELEIK